MRHNEDVTAILAAIVLLMPDNALTAAERRAGWKLLFDGKTTNGWTNFKSTKLNTGWQVKDGTLAVVDENNAGDIVSAGKFDWFELSLDFKLGPGQNSGVMFRVADSGEATWHSGPEVQLYDHKMEPGVQITGFLYELYPSKVDAAKPGGQWNHLRMLVSPKKCQTDVNGVKYYEYVIDSPDFWSRVAKSKFNAFPGFAKTKKGRIAIQGDHGVVSFKNMKIREIKG